MLAWREDKEASIRDKRAEKESESRRDGRSQSAALILGKRRKKVRFRLITQPGAWLGVAGLFFICGRICLRAKKEKHFDTCLGVI